MEKYNRFFACKDETFDFGFPLLENTFDIDRDVDFLYKVGFDSFIKTFSKNRSTEEASTAKDMIDIVGQHWFKSINSRELKSRDCKEAHSYNPIDIFLGISKKGSLYYPESHRIDISLNESLFNLMILPDWISVFNSFATSKKKLTLSEFSEKKIKSTIAHELSHWLNDTLHNYHITDLSKLSTTLNDDDIFKLKKHHVSLTHFEIDAQIHGIKNLKNNCSRTWDQMTMYSVFINYTSLTQILITVTKKYGKDVADVWQKNLMKRMARENLLGKNMKSFADYDKLTESDFGV